MTTNNCTCPGGDRSLQHPCPENPAQHLDSKMACGAPRDGRDRYPECDCETEEVCQYGTQPEAKAEAVAHNPDSNGATEPCDAPNGGVPCSCGAWHAQPETAGADATYEVRRWCSGDGAWTQWQQCTDQYFRENNRDESLQFRHAQPKPEAAGADMRDAYAGAREDPLEWKRRAQRAETELRKLGYAGIDASERPEANAKEGVDDREYSDADVIADLKAYAKILGSQAELAKEYKVSPAYVSGVLTGKRSIPEHWAMRMGYSKPKWQRSVDRRFSDIAQPKAAEGGADDNGWEANARCLLDRSPHAIRVCEGGGPEDLLKSLVVTFMAMEQKLAMAAPAGSGAVEQSDLALSAAKAISQVRQGNSRWYRLYLDDAEAAIEGIKERIGGVILTASSGEAVAWVSRREFDFLRANSGKTGAAAGVCAGDRGHDVPLYAGAPPADAQTLANANRWRFVSDLFGQLTTGRSERMLEALGLDETRATEPLAAIVDDARHLAGKGER